MGLGDEVIVTGQVRELQERDPRRVVIDYEGKKRWFDVWDHNPRIARHDEPGDHQIFRPRKGYMRPYIADKTPNKWTWKAWRPPRGEFYLTKGEIEFGRSHAGKVILQPQIKAAAPINKQWGLERWEALAAQLVAEGLRVAVIGAEIRTFWKSVEPIQTRSIRQAAAVLSTCAAAIVPEGALHHVAAAVGARAAVIYGGYISPEVTGYEDQIAFFTGSELGCGKRQLCSHCQQAMKRIAPAEVAEAALRLARMAPHGL